MPLKNRAYGACHTHQVLTNGDKPLCWRGVVINAPFAECNNDSSQLAQTIIACNTEAESSVWTSISCINISNTHQMPREINLVTGMNKVTQRSSQLHAQYPSAVTIKVCECPSAVTLRVCECSSAGTTIVCECYNEVPVIFSSVINRLQQRNAFLDRPSATTWVTNAAFFPRCSTSLMWSVHLELNVMPRNKSPKLVV
jgi:hypothetical protein